VSVVFELVSKINSGGVSHLLHLAYCGSSKSPLTDSALKILMESHVMSEPKFDIYFWGIRISAQGLAGIAAAVLVVGMLLAVYRY
jgi:hypothetical protein